MVGDSHPFLLSLCEDVASAQSETEEETRLSSWTHLVVMRADDVRIEIRKEAAPHKEPHLHISHSDKIDVSLSLKDFRPLAGRIDYWTWKRLLPELVLKREELMDIWVKLDAGDAVGAHKVISSLRH
jgi:hypothetical protein